MRKFGIGILLIPAVILCFIPSGFAEDITVVGTGAGMFVLKSLGEAFSRKNPEIKIIVPESIGSSGGIKSVGTDKEKIARVSREIKDTEKHYGLKYLPFAKLPIVFFVNKNVNINELSPQQICDIYSGKTVNWKDLGGADEPVRVIRREDGDSALEVLLASLPGFKGIAITAKSKTTFTDQETVAAAEEKNGTLAFGPYSNTFDHGVKVLSIAGKKPTDSDYPYNSILALVFKEENHTGNIKKFIEFVSSPDARDVISSAGGMPSQP